SGRAESCIITPRSTITSSACGPMATRLTLLYVCTALSSRRFTCTCCCPAPGCAPICGFVSDITSLHFAQKVVVFPRGKLHDTRSARKSHWVGALKNRQSRRGRGAFAAAQGDDAYMAAKALGKRQGEAGLPGRQGIAGGCLTMEMALHGKG